jgi:uncharacterized protein (DUF433 family)
MLKRPGAKAFGPLAYSPRHDSEGKSVMTSTVIANDPVPLRVEENGTIRVGNTRITLDTVIHFYLAGLTAEEIAEQYEALALADVYSAIAYYLHHREDVDRYIEERGRQAEVIRTKIEARQDHSGLRERLQARLSDK